MLKSYYQSIGKFMACDEFYPIINEICNLISFCINYNLS